MIDLLNCKSVQRLKGISQFGLPQEYYHLPIFSRYEHSLGVLSLLIKLNAELKEQIAGLLHDVSHTAFSHTIDWVFGDPTKEDFQDKLHENIIEKSEIKDILIKYGYDYKEISSVKNFSLLERESPSLCADRIDYTLRETALRIDLEKAKFCFNSLIKHNNCFAFKSIDAAKIFSDMYVKFQQEHWGGNEAKARYHILAEILKIGIQKKFIYFQDFKKTDDFVINLLKNRKDEDILYGLELLKNGFLIKASEDGNVELKSKFRYIDPEILIENQIKKLSEISNEYKTILENEKENYKNYVRVNILRLNAQRNL